MNKNYFLPLQQLFARTGQGVNLPRELHVGTEHMFYTQSPFAPKRLFRVDDIAACWWGGDRNPLNVHLCEIFSLHVSCARAAFCEYYLFFTM